MAHARRLPLHRSVTWTRDDNEFKIADGSEGGALGATIKFFQRMGAKEHAIDRSHGAKAKIWCFIGILIFQMLQDVSEDHYC